MINWESAINVSHSAKLVLTPMNASLAMMEMFTSMASALKIVWMGIIQIMASVSYVQPLWSTVKAVMVLTSALLVKLAMLWNQMAVNV